MSKITPQEYIDARADLAIAGFIAIKDRLRNKDKIEDIAKDYLLDQRIVEIVKTTANPDQFNTIAQLETERAEAQGKIDAQELEEATRQLHLYKPTPPSPIQRWHYVASILILACFGYLIYLFLNTIIGIIIGGF